MPKVIPEYKEKAKQRIIEAATRAFAQNGYHQTSMDNIAELLGVSKGAIYQYFKSKQQLFFDVFQSALIVQKDEVMSIILSDNPLYIASEEFFETKISRARSFGLDMFLEAARNEAIKTRMTKIYDRSYAEFTKHVEDLKNQGVIKRSADVGVVWRGLIALRDGLLSSVFLGADTSDAKKTWQKVATLLLNEILVKETG
ncbi:MAG: TetR/AcrR family transcriptional regulator [Candidatus Thorarchaeota archaeon]|nr:TetR/AcrR family transcriptional regulator [Candidatus Thorarchaeota archaeon]